MSNEYHPCEGYSGVLEAQGRRRGIATRKARRVQLPRGLARQRMHRGAPWNLLGSSLACTAVEFCAVLFTRTRFTGLGTYLVYLVYEWVPFQCLQYVITHNHSNLSRKSYCKIFWHLFQALTIDLLEIYIKIIEMWILYF